MALPTLAEVKLHLRVDSDQEDSLILSLIAGAVDHFEQTARRVLGQRTIVERLDSVPSHGVIFLNKGPVISVTSVTIRNSSISQDPVLVPSVDYITMTGQTETKPCVAFRSTSNLPTVDGLPGAVTITYEAGTVDVPESVNAAIKMLVGHWYENRQAVGPTGGGEVPLAFASVANKYLWGAYN